MKPSITATVATKMKCYLVGGAVRDQLLDYPFHEHDWVVVGSTPEELLKQGYTAVGKDFPVFLHPETKEEYALARTERKTGTGYTGFACHFASDVTLEQDLERRDLTINAIAQDQDGNLFDPYGGVDDIHQRVLRHVSSAFSEDPLRVLRTARFAARYHHLGFCIASETLALMASFSAEEILAISAERIWRETEKALHERHPEVFFSVLRDCGVLKILFPEIDALFGVPQPEKHHPEIDTGVHVLLCLAAAVELSDKAEIRFATLCHDLGKALTPPKEWPKHHGHEKKGLKPLKQLCRRIRAPKRYEIAAALCCEYHTHIHRAFELRADTIVKLLKSCDAYRKPERFNDLLISAKADSRGRPGFEHVPYLQADYLWQCYQLSSNVNVREFIQQGLSGKEIAEAIDQERSRIIKHYKKNYLAEQQI